MSFSQILEVAQSSTSQSLSILGFLVSILSALVIGMLISIVFKRTSKTSKSFLMTLAILPAIVAAIITVVNGSIGAGIAVAGTFSLVRFRSLPGTAKEIGALFLAMSSGLISGMGHPEYAFVYTVVMGIAFYVYTYTRIIEPKNTERMLYITVPESLNFSNLFDDLMEVFTVKSDMVGMRTTNMGSMFKLSYKVELKNEDIEKDFIDAIRCRNGNLEILSNRYTEGSEL